jgi:nucleotide-binding universal stress UspA family protein
MKLKCPISKVLLPVDGSEHSIRAVKFTGYLGTSLNAYPSEVALLRVITGRYMNDHMSYVDFRAEILKQSDTFARFKERHIEMNIKPSLDECEKILIDIGIKAKVEKLILDGDPAHEIVQLANKKKFSTIVLGRRGLSEIMSILLGSITNKVIHSAIKQTVYVVGHTILEDKNCPVPKILIPVDGSSYSMKGIEHAAGMAKEMKESISKITLLRVINMAIYEKRLREGIDPEEEAKKIFEDAKTLFLNAGVPENLLIMKKSIGSPSEEIIKETEEGGYNLIIMGRKGRSALKDLILGGVSTTVLQRCQNPTIALVNSK